MTTNNDDSCDIGIAPAATLLLPIFEVETAQRSTDVLFTVINVSHRPQITRVTIWTDWSYPVLSFDLFLTGYDVQAVSLYDLIVEGKLPAGCTTSPAAIPAQTAAAIRSALNNGRFQANGFAGGCGETRVASPASVRQTATTAAGYVTIDVVDTCGSTSPNDPSYIAKELRFDNVLTGDYQAVDTSAGRNYAVGSPLVHIRAVPEGGAGGLPLSGRQTNLPYTFYSRFINGQVVDGRTYSGTLMNYDRRQPLPATFAGRFVQSGFPGAVTDFKIWREGPTGPVTCSNASGNSSLRISELVRFDEHENAMVYDCLRNICIGPPGPPTLPAAARAGSASGTFPIFSSPAGDQAGWMYLNLHSLATTGGFDVEQHPQFGTRASQNWVSIAMYGGNTAANGLYSVESHATQLGNGCSTAIGSSVINGGIAPIGPAPNLTP